MSKKKTKAANELVPEDCEMRHIRLGDIQIGNYRKEMDNESILNLAENIKKNGLLQEPAVYELDNGMYQLIYGQRRMMAWMLNNPDENSTILLKVYPGMTPERAEEIALIENCQRENPSDADTFLAIEQLMKNGKKQKDIALMLGLSKLYVARMVALQKLPKTILDKFREGVFGLELASQIGSLPDDIMDAVSSDLEQDPDMIIDSNYLDDVKTEIRLDRASFDLKDAKLYPKMGACTKCMFNTSVNPILAELHEDDEALCTNRECYKTKQELGILDRIINNVYELKGIYTTDDLNDYPVKIRMKLEEAGFSFLGEKESFLEVINGRLMVSGETKEETITNYLNNFVQGYIDHSDFEDNEEYVALARKFFDTADKVLTDYPELLIMVVEDDFETVRFGIDMSEAPEINQMIELLGLTRISDEPEPDEENDEDDQEDEHGVEEFVESHGERATKAKPVDPLDAYTDPATASMLISKKKRNGELMQERLAEWLRKDALKEDMCYRYNFASNVEATNPLTADEELAYWSAIADNVLSGRSDIGNAISKLYEFYTDNKLKSYQTDTNALLIGRLAVSNKAFRTKLQLAFTYKILLSEETRMDPSLENNANSVAFNSILTQGGEDRIVAQGEMQKIADTYDKKNKNIDEKLNLLLKRQEPKAPEEEEEMIDF